MFTVHSTVTRLFPGGVYMIFVRNVIAFQQTTASATPPFAQPADALGATKDMFEQVLFHAVLYPTRDELRLARKRREGLRPES